VTLVGTLGVGFSLVWTSADKGPTEVEDKSLSFSTALIGWLIPVVSTPNSSLRTEAKFLPNTPNVGDEGEGEDESNTWSSLWGLSELLIRLRKRVKELATPARELVRADVNPPVGSGATEGADDAGEETTYEPGAEGDGGWLRAKLQKKRKSAKRANRKELRIPINYSQQEENKENKENEENEAKKTKALRKWKEPLVRYLIIIIAL
jgi:hypothetical protein